MSTKAVEDLPRTATGKVRMADLRERLRASCAEAERDGRMIGRAP